MQIKTDKRFVIIPVNEHLPRTKKVTFFADGVPVYCLDIRLDPVRPTFYAYIDVSRYKNTAMTLTVAPEVDFLPEYADSFDEKELYSADERPSVHFTTPLGWINDPNGLVKYKDTYHMFYQHNPADTVWGNMHWGHAVSHDLIHWENKPIALYPDMHGTMYSGSAIVDTENVSGLKEGDEDPILFFYTYNIKNRTQNIAYSTDGGKTLKNYEGNPVVEHIEGGNRDPKVIYCPELGKYLMALYLIGDRFLLLTSDDLLSWEKYQEISLPGDNECPDIYRLPLGKENYYIFTGAHSTIRIGKFVDGKLTPVRDDCALQYDDDKSYASQSFEDGERRIDIAWQRKMTVPGAKFCGQMSIPTECTLSELGGKIHLRQYPIEEISSLYSDVRSWKKLTIDESWSFRTSERAFDLILDTPYNEGSILTLNIYGEPIKIDMKENKLTVGKISMPLSIEKERVDLRIIADRLSLEIFTDKGASALTVKTYADYNLPSLTVWGEKIEFEDLKVAGLRSIWEC